MSLETTPILTFMINKIQMGAGYLIVHQSWRGDDLIEELFTLESLAHVMDLPMTTMNGRYQRANLTRWMRPIMSRYGRPIRGFPLHMLKDVETVIRERNSAVDQDVHGSGIVRAKPAKIVAELTPVYRGHEAFYKITALAVAFGLSPSTVRKRLAAYGLMRKFEDVTKNTSGGRPQRGIAEKWLPDVKRAIEDGIHFKAKPDDRNDPQYVEDRQAMLDSVAAHTKPQGLEAYEPMIRAPAKPQLAPMSDEVNALFGDAMGFAEALLASPIKPAAVPVVVNPVNVPLPFKVINPPEIEDPKQMARQMWNQHRDFLAGMPGEPDEEDFELVVHALALKASDEERFRDEVASLRGGL